MDRAGEQTVLVNVRARQRRAGLRCHRGGRNRAERCDWIPVRQLAVRTAHVHDCSLVAAADEPGEEQRERDPRGQQSLAARGTQARASRSHHPERTTPSHLDATRMQKSVVRSIKRALINA